MWEWSLLSRHSTSEEGGCRQLRLPGKSPLQFAFLISIYSCCKITTTKQPLQAENLHGSSSTSSSVVILPPLSADVKAPRFVEQLLDSTTPEGAEVGIIYPDDWLTSVFQYNFHIVSGSSRVLCRGKANAQCHMVQGRSQTTRWEQNVDLHG